MSKRLLRDGVMFETPDPLTVSDDSSLTVSGSGGFLRG